MNSIVHAWELFEISVGDAQVLFQFWDLSRGKLHEHLPLAAVSDISWQVSLRGRTRTFQASTYRVYGGQICTGTSISRVLVLSPVSVIPPMLHMHAFKHHPRDNLGNWQHWGLRCTGMSRSKGFSRWPWTASHFNIGSTCRPETWVTNCQHMLCNISEERRYELHRGGILKSRADSRHKEQYNISSVLKGQRWELELDSSQRPCRQLLTNV